MGAIRSCRALPLIGLLALPAAHASAQGMPPQPGQPGVPPCVSQFMQLRQEVEKRGLAAKAGNEHHVSREEMCKLIQAYAAAETKMVKYAEDNNVWCGIPAQIVEQMKTGHAKTLKVRQAACAAGPVGPAKPAAPTLSDALGTTRVPDAATTKTGRGTLDSLTGNPIAR
ncbi:MAG TPA: hypothetical protein VG985_00690 [Xanthobacteraceae bacterium]|nr:hypothetical protein [Xanthobacteraceae bacterium]